MRQAVDCHFHVIGPASQFPLAAQRSYTPNDAPLAAWRSTVSALGISQGMVVQPSVYGTDNRALLAALKDGAGSVAGVGAATESVSDAQLDALVEAGVRGLRFAHFESGDLRGMPGFVPLAALWALAPRLRARDLHADVFTDSRLLPGIADRLRATGLPVVLDHMGRAPAHLGVGHEGILTMCRLLGEGWLWVKLSGIANLSDQAPGYADARKIHEALVSANPHRLVWGSDWPHTRPHKRPHKQSHEQGTAPLFQHFLNWTPQAEVRARILCQNAHELYRFAMPPVESLTQSVFSGSNG